MQAQTLQNFRTTAINASQVRCGGTVLDIHEQGKFSIDFQNSNVNIYENRTSNLIIGSEQLENITVDNFGIIHLRDNVTINGVNVIEQLGTITQGLGNEITNRQNADTTLQNNINAEITNRQNADTTLQNNLNIETQNRQYEDNVLQSNITTETQQREQVDQQLQTQISNEITNRQNAVITLQNNLNTETQSREQADQTLQSNISYETQQRIAADTSLRNDIGVVNKQTNLTTLSQQIGYNVTSSSDLQTQINNIQQQGDAQFLRYFTPSTDEVVSLKTNKTLQFEGINVLSLAQNANVQAPFNNTTQTLMQQGLGAISNNTAYPYQCGEWIQMYFKGTAPWLFYLSNRCVAALNGQSTPQFNNINVYPKYSGNKVPVRQTGQSQVYYYQVFYLDATPQSYTGFPYFLNIWPPQGMTVPDTVENLNLTHVFFNDVIDDSIVQGSKNLYMSSSETLHLNSPQILVNGVPLNTDASWLNALFGFQQPSTYYTKQPLTFTQDIIASQDLELQGTENIDIQYKQQVDDQPTSITLQTALRKLETSYLQSIIGTYVEIFGIKTSISYLYITDKLTLVRGGSVKCDNILFPVLDIIPRKPTQYVETDNFMICSVSSNAYTGVSDLIIGDVFDTTMKVLTPKSLSSNIDVIWYDVVRNIWVFDNDVQQGMKFDVTGLTTYTLQNNFTIRPKTGQTFPSGVYLQVPFKLQKGGHYIEFVSQIQSQLVSIQKQKNIMYQMYSQTQIIVNLTGFCQEIMLQGTLNLKGTFACDVILQNVQLLHDSYIICDIGKLTISYCQISGSTISGFYNVDECIIDEDKMLNMTQDARIITGISLQNFTMKNVQPANMSTGIVQNSKMIFDTQADFNTYVSEVNSVINSTIYFKTTNSSNIQEYVPETGNTLVFKTMQISSDSIIVNVKKYAAQPTGYTVTTTTGASHDFSADDFYATMQSGQKRLVYIAPSTSAIVMYVGDNFDFSSAFRAAIFDATAGTHRGYTFDLSNVHKGYLESFFPAYQSQFTTYRAPFQYMNQDVILRQLSTQNVSVQFQQFLSTAYPARIVVTGSLDAIIETDQTVQNTCEFNVIFRDVSFGINMSIGSNIFEGVHGICFESVACPNGLMLDNKTTASSLSNKINYYYIASGVITVGMDDDAAEPCNVVFDMIENYTNVPAANITNRTNGKTVTATKYINAVIGV